ncbi:unnamed protein product [Linum trigynum]|uniref:Uncharacterized protein n=1 Tax=Linum trigynum TaxID=586398 RepID=A0AAV2FQC5_9ROSI
MLHSTNSCVVFCNLLQDVIEKGRIKLPEPKKDAMLVDTNPFPNLLGVNMVNPDFSKIELPRFKLVLDTTTQQGTPTMVFEQGESSKGMQANSAASKVSSGVEKLCAQCKRSSRLDEVRPNRPVQQRIGPPHRPRYPSYQRQVEGVIQPTWGQRRQWVAHDPLPMRRTSKMPNVPQGVGHTYDMHSQPVAIGGMTKTQRRRFLRKNAKARKGQYPVVPGEMVRPTQQNEDGHASIEVDNSMTTGSKVIVSDQGKHAQVQSDGKGQKEKKWCRG